MSRCEWIVLAVVVSAGCGGEPFQRAPVAGQISFEGTPIEQGTITFVPSSEPGAIASAEIKNGRYEIPKAVGPSVGKHQVQILGLRKNGKQPAGSPHPPGTMVDVYEQFLSAEYNHQSKLTADIQTTPNKVDFALPLP